MNRLLVLAIVIIGLSFSCTEFKEDDNGNNTNNTQPIIQIVLPLNGEAYAPGETISFGCIASDAEDGEVSHDKLIWRSNLDGQIGTGISFEKNNLSSGQQVVILIGTDSDGASSSDTVTFAVTGGSNLAPIVTITAPQNGAEFEAQQPIQFTGEANDPEEGALSGNKLVWNSSINGDFGIGLNTTTSNLGVGNHVITLIATDSQIKSGTASINIRVVTPGENQVPTVTISAPANNAEFELGDPITFVGSATDPEEGELPGASLRWFSNLAGEIGTGFQIVRSDLVQGTHTIALEAKDSQGGTGIAYIYVRINDNGTEPHDTMKTFIWAIETLKDEFEAKCNCNDLFLYNVTCMSIQANGIALQADFNTAIHPSWYSASQRKAYGCAYNNGQYYFFDGIAMNPQHEINLPVINSTDVMDIIKQGIAGVSDYLQAEPFALIRMDLISANDEDPESRDRYIVAIDYPGPGWMVEIDCHNQEILSILHDK